MGRAKAPFVKPLMTAPEVARFLLESCESLRGFDSFMFGSSLFGIGSDLDILIVGPCGEPLAKLKGELRHAGKALPLDVLFMTPSEAAETGFVKREECITLAQLASGRDVPDGARDERP